MNVTVSLSYDPANTEERKALAGVLGMLGALPPLVSAIRPAPVKERAPEKSAPVEFARLEDPTPGIDAETGKDIRKQESDELRTAVRAESAAKREKAPAAAAAKAPKLTLDDLKVALRALVSEVGFDDAKKVLAGMGFRQLIDVKPSDFARVLDGLKAATSNGEAGEVEVEVDEAADGEA
jgi:hypothetical protein